MQLPQIYFDIDKTMIDTKLLMKNCQASLQSTGVESEMFVQVLNKYLATLPNKTFFDPEQFLDLLAKQSQTSKDVLQEIFWLPANFEHSLFPEVLSVLEALSPKTKLGTFSQGVSYWQQKKLELSGLTKFFPEDKRIIESDKLSAEIVGRLKPGAWVIDDKEEVVETLKAARPDLQVFWIVRSEDETPTDSIQSLTEVLEKFNSQSI